MFCWSWLLSKAARRHRKACGDTSWGHSFTTFLNTFWRYSYRVDASACASSKCSSRSLTSCKHRRQCWGFKKVAWSAYSGKDAPEVEVAGKTRSCKAGSDPFQLCCKAVFARCSSLSSFTKAYSSERLCVPKRLWQRCLYSLAFCATVLEHRTRHFPAFLQQRRQRKAPSLGAGSTDARMSRATCLRTCMNLPKRVRFLRLKTRLAILTRVG